ncbi:MAG: ATP-dependent sacrificial sulfur transferase LarE [Thermodesulfobacteriota bacterium]|nr:ATP-dependent sacrificial sulfur transferase LarE [Thermodesulfobacteriota bacterium]
MNNKFEALKAIISSSSAVAVAFSGGVDSSLVVKAAMDALGPGRVLALTASSRLQIRKEKEHAISMAEEIGCRLITIDVDLLSWRRFTDNPHDRCYHCKNRIYSLFLKTIADQDIPVLMDGTNTDDLNNDDRPGLRAIRELGVKTPLAQAGFAKKDVRYVSRQLGLSNWNHLSSSCLATRIPTGSIISESKIETIARCENFLNSLGFFGCRVRLYKDHAGLELISGDIERFSEPNVRTNVINYFSGQEINKIFLDLSERQDIIFF